LVGLEIGAAVKEWVQLVSDIIPWVIEVPPCSSRLKTEAAGSIACWPHQFFVREFGLKKSKHLILSQKIGKACPCVELGPFRFFVAIFHQCSPTHQAILFFSRVRRMNPNWHCNICLNENKCELTLAVGLHYNLS
jgi:hypothetical protein